MTAENFTPDCLPLLIGSLPLNDHNAAAGMVFEYTPEIPLWVQLPVFRHEGMISQFLPGMPGLTTEGDKTFVNMADDAFAEDMLAFYEEYMAITEAGAPLDDSRFAMNPDVAAGFFTFMEYVEKANPKPAALKGQITGPLTFATAVKDQDGRSVFYDIQSRDIAVKLLALRAGWQTRQMARFGLPVIMFLDEPALAGFGSSEFISISKEEMIAALDEIIDAVHAEGGLTGIHVCANTEWDMVMDTKVDIVNFDAYSFFDKFILYSNAIRKHFQAGKMVAWGIVPTSLAEDIDRETPESLVSKWNEQMKQVEALGIDRATLIRQSFITPSCGTGSLSPARAEKVLQLTQAVSAQIRQ